MKSLVLDASVSAAWAMPDADSEYATAMLKAVFQRGAWVPWIWWFEARNVLVINERRGNIAGKLAREHLALLTDLPVEIDSAPDEVATLYFAEKHGLTFYDATYLELATRTGSALATLDRRLISAARAEGAFQSISE